MGIPTYSAGGILLKRDGYKTYIVIVEWEKNVPPKWAPILRQLPKGGCQEDESLEETAIREVQEETGYRGNILTKAGEAKWSYERGGQIWDETVAYYFMTPQNIDPEQHDNEFDNVRWVDIENAADLLSYPPEKELILGIISKNAIPGF